MKNDKEQRIIEDLAVRYGALETARFRTAADVLLTEYGEWNKYAERKIGRVSFDSLKIDSPIERLLAVALLSELLTSWRDWQPAIRSGGSFDQLRGQVEEATTVGNWLQIWHQAKVGTYTADFLIAIRPRTQQPVWGIVECDGHDFHEKTRKQVSHDKARDRFFQSRDIAVLRYPGSDIWRSATAVAEESLATMRRIAISREAPPDKDQIERLISSLPPNAEIIMRIGNKSMRLFRDAAGRPQMEPWKAGVKP